MDSNVVVAMIGVAGIILGALSKVGAKYLLSIIESIKADIPDLVGHWEGEWFLEEQGEETPFVNDIINITRQRGFTFWGEGKDNAGTYRFTGTISLPGVICFTYKYADTPILMTGAVILEIHPKGKHCEGRWYGYSVNRKIEGGRVKWIKKGSPGTSL